MEVKPIDTAQLTRSRLEVTIIKVISPLLFLVHINNSKKNLEDLEEELEFRMTRKAKYLHCWPEDIKEDEDVVVKEDNTWRRGWIDSVNPDNNMVKICLGDYGREIWCPKGEIYYLEDRFKELPWQVVACGLAYTGLKGRGQTWPDKTNELCRILAEGHKGWINIVQPIRRGAALVKLTVQGENFSGSYNLRDVLVQLGHARVSQKVTVDVFPAV
ncbi:hypothetical protein ACFW04_011503 [Cataglyphis niger]